MTISGQPTAAPSLRWSGHPSLGTRLRRQFLLMGVLPVVAVFSATWLLLVPVLVGQADARNREIALVVRDQVALQFELRLNAADVLAKTLPGRAPADVQRGLDAALAADPFLNGIFVVDAAGRVAVAALARGASRNPGDTIGLDLTGFPHVAQARSRQQAVWSDAFLSTLTGGLTAALAVPSGDGLLVQELSVSALSRSVGELAQNGGSQVAIVDRAGRVIAHPNARLAQQQESLQTLPPVRDALAGREGSARLTGPDGDDLVQALPVAPIGWAVVVSRPVSTVMAPLRSLGSAVAALLAFTVVLAVVVGWRMARQTGGEVALLADGAQRAVRERDPPELQFSSAEFNAVWQRLRDLFVQLAESGERTQTAKRDLQAVLDAATQVAIIATDRAGSVTVFNVGAQRLLGWKASEVVGQISPLAWHDESDVALRAGELGHRHGLAIEGFEVLVFEARHSGYEVRDWGFVRRDGSRVDVSMAVTAMRTQDGALTGFLLVAIDITERRRAEQLELARRSAEAASRAKSDFLSRMSHELRTPLNAILGYAQLLEVGTDQQATPQQHEWLLHIQRAGWHLVRLIEDVLDLARIEAGGMRVVIAPVALAPVVAQAVQIVQPLLQQQQVSLSTDIEDGLPQVAADETRLLQVLVNLLSNAAKYNRWQGKVQLTARDTPLGVQITVADTGPGLTPEQQTHLFEPFNRLGQERSGIEGTGIGLVITRHLVEMMHGHLSVHSALDKGATFVIVMPKPAVASDMQASPPTGAGGPAAGPRTVRGRVVYFEDNEVNSQLMRAILRQRPEIELEVCVDASSGLAAVRREPPDLVLLDMHLPDAHGESVLAALRAEPGGGALPIVVVSADATQAQMDATRALGVRDYLTKPLDLAATLRVIDEALMEHGATPKTN